MKKAPEKPTWGEEGEVNTWPDSWEQQEVDTKGVEAQQKAWETAQQMWQTAQETQEQVAALKKKAGEWWKEAVQELVETVKKGRRRSCCKSKGKSMKGSKSMMNSCCICSNNFIISSLILKITPYVKIGKFYP